MGLSIWHLLIVLLVVLVLFGSRLPNVMGDIGKGIRNFKAGLNDGDEKTQPTKKITSDDQDGTPRA